MAYGVEFRDASGNITLTLSDRLPRYLGSTLIVAPGSSGSITNDGFLTGIPFWEANMYSNNALSYWPGEGLLPPDVSIVGNVLTYSVNLGLPTQSIQYGVY